MHPGPLRVGRASHRDHRCGSGQRPLLSFCAFLQPHPALLHCSHGRLHCLQDIPQGCLAGLRFMHGVMVMSVWSTGLVGLLARYRGIIMQILGVHHTLSMAASRYINLASMVVDFSYFSRGWRWSQSTQIIRVEDMEQLGQMTSEGKVVARFGQTPGVAHRLFPPNQPQFEIMNQLHKCFLCSK